MSSVLIRYAELDDLGHALEIDYVKKEKFLKRKIEDKQIVLAEKNNNPIGYMRFGDIWGVVPLLELIKVDEKHRRQEIAKTMLVKLSDTLKKEKHTYLLSSCENPNELSKKWHEALGFKYCGKLENINLDHNNDELFWKLEIK